jgi:hypothetical protein
LATALEHGKPIKEAEIGSANEPSSDVAFADSKAATATFVDPVKRYQHYEAAYLNGELDPAFKTLDTWELRMVVNSDVPDEILTWGREMLGAYRPDHISNPDYGWRYSGLVRTDVPYGSQNVQLDLPNLSEMQNILKHGGVCGRRAFFGRYILRCFGIPVWGVTQHKHAALSHWTPNGWVVNFGAGFGSSWWDKGDVPMSGDDFLVEAKARKHPQDYARILRMRWVSLILGEKRHNGRRGEAGGTWSNLAQYDAGRVAAAKADLGPLGEHLAEANDSPEAVAKALMPAKVLQDDAKVSVDAAGTITISAAACTGKNPIIGSYRGGQQMICSANFGITFTAPRAGKYNVTLRIINVRLDGAIATRAADSKAEIAIPYTMGRWKLTDPVELTLRPGKNDLTFDVAAHIALKEVILAPAD